MALPALRPLDISPIEHEGENYICLQDPTGTVDNPLLLTPMAFFIATQLTGSTDVPEIQDAFEKQVGGMTIPPERIYEIVEHLDEHGFLFTETFEALRREVVVAFAKAPIRSAHLAGKSYSDDPGELRDFLDEQFLREGGPGETPGSTPGDGPPLPGLIVPHIDLHRGGHVYAHGYRRLYQGGQPDTVFIFGVAHTSEPAPFILTKKHFETPLGLLETDTEIVERLENACDWDPYLYEIAHRTEHSIEFQVLMLAHLYGPNVRIVPILCSALSEDPTLNDPTSLDGVGAFLNACRDSVEDPGKRVSVVAAADLAHVGKRFGDSFDIDDTIVRNVEIRDGQDLAFVHAAQPESFYSSVMKDFNQRRVCGLNCIYATLKSLEGVIKEGRGLKYDYAHDPSGGIVSFASIALT